MKLKRDSETLVESELVHVTDFVLIVSAWSGSVATVVRRDGSSTSIDVGTATTWLSQIVVQVQEAPEGVTACRGCKT